jgi:hypothetical protein
MAGQAPVLEERPLTGAEQVLVRWLLEHGRPDAADFLPQLGRARVVSRCPCGCASIDLAIDEAAPPAGAGMSVLSDYFWVADDGSHCGVFVFARGGLLAGLEVWSADGIGSVTELPAVERLRPLQTAGPCAGSTPGSGNGAG